MGSGQYASEGFRQAAYFRNLTYYWEPSKRWWWSAGSLSVTDAACYSGHGPFSGSSNAWKNWFYYGGQDVKAVVVSKQIY